MRAHQGSIATSAHILKPTLVTDDQMGGYSYPLESRGIDQSQQPSRKSTFTAAYAVQGVTTKSPAPPTNNTRTITHLEKH